MADICKPDNSALREAVDVPDDFPASRHREYIESLRSDYSHTVVFRQSPYPSTCVLYAFNLSQVPTYRAVAGNFGGRIFAGQAFMQWLVDGHLAEIDRPADGCLVMYFNQGVWQHLGIYCGSGRVVSQWGTFSVYEHDLCELPARYGDEVRYFPMPGRGEPLRLFLEFAKAQGLSDRDIARAVATSTTTGR